VTTPTRRADPSGRERGPGLFERWFHQLALSVVVATGLYRYVDPWSHEQVPAHVPIPAPRGPEP
jgi:hypothetical protein